jgi:hypothetical protein
MFALKMAVAETCRLKNKTNKTIFCVKICCVRRREKKYLIVNTVHSGMEETHRIKSGILQGVQEVYVYLMITIQKVTILSLPHYLA